VTRPQGGRCDMGAYEARPFTISTVSGDSQETPVTTPFSNPLVVQVANSYGDPVDGGIVVYSVPTSGASAILIDNPATILNGQASVTATANSYPGQYLATARVTGLEPVSFQLKNIIAKTSTSLTTAPNPSSFGQSFVLTATVGILPPGTGIVPTGTVTFYNGTTKLQDVSVDAKGIASFRFSNKLLVGNYQFSASYNGTPGYSSSVSELITQTVIPAPTTVSLIVSPTPSLIGQTTTLTATVAVLSQYVGTVSDGTVTFYAETTKLQEVPVNSEGIATYTFNDNLTVGDHSLSAVYNGSDGFRTSSSEPVAHSVNPGATAIELISSSRPSAFGQPVTFTATVNSVPPAVGIPSGNITFTVGNVDAIVVHLTQDGNAVYTANDLKPGVYDVQAAYGGESRFLNSISPIVHHTVLSGTVTTSLSSSSNPLDLGQSATLTVTVTPNLPATDIPTGKVTIRMGDVDLQTLDLDVNGTAVYTVTDLQPGTYTYSAIYNGDSSFGSATSPILTQTILKGTTIITSTSSPSPSKFGEDVVIVADVGTANIYNINPTGYVTFTIGSLSPKVVELDQDGKAQYLAENLSPGKYSISVAYSGDDNFSSSTASAASHTVAPGTVTITLNSATSPSKSDQPITFTARVIANSPATELPTGKVIFAIDDKDRQAVDISQDGTAVYTLTNLSPASYKVVAEYSGDENYSSSVSAVWTQIVDWIRCFLPVVIR